MADQLPEGVKRWEPVLLPDRDLPHNDIARMQEAQSGRFVYVSDLDAIRQQAIQEERERLRVAFYEQAEEYRREMPESGEGRDKLFVAANVVAAVTRCVFDDFASTQPDSEGGSVIASWPKQIIICLECGAVVGPENPVGCSGGEDEYHGPTQTVSVVPVRATRACSTRTR